MTDVPHSRTISGVLILAAALLMVPLAAHAYAGTFSRYMGDDYCGSVVFRREGLLGAQKYYYLHWNAVPSMILLMAVTEPGGSTLARWLPAVTVVLWVASLRWALVPLTSRLYPSALRLLAFVLAEALVFVTIEDAPNIVQSLYLRVSMLAYSVPLIGLSAYAGYCIRFANDNTRSRLARTIVSAAIAFALGAIGPLYAAMQTAAVASAIGLTFAFADTEGRVRLRQVLVSGLLGSLGAITVIIAAPGNAVRQSRLATPDSFNVVGQTAIYTALMFLRPLLRFRSLITHVIPAWVTGTAAWTAMAMSMRSSLLIGALVTGAGVALAWFTPALVARRTRRHLLLAIPLIAVLITGAAMAVGAYGISAPPPDRALIMPQFVLECLLGAWSFLAGAAVRDTLAAHGAFPGRLPAIGLVVVMMLLAVAVTRSTIRTLSLTPSLRAWASAWDQTDAALQNAARRGERRSSVRLVPLASGLGWISRDPTNWVNKCMASYYGLESVAAQ